MRLLAARAAELLRLLGCLRLHLRFGSVGLDHFQAGVRQHLLRVDPGGGDRARLEALRLGLLRSGLGRFDARLGLLGACGLRFDCLGRLLPQPLQCFLPLQLLFALVRSAVPARLAVGRCAGGRVLVPAALPVAAITVAVAPAAALLVAFAFGPPLLSLRLWLLALRKRLRLRQFLQLLLRRLRLSLGLGLRLLRGTRRTLVRPALAALLTAIAALVISTRLPAAALLEPALLRTLAAISAIASAATVAAAIATVLVPVASVASFATSLLVAPRLALSRLLCGPHWGRVSGNRRGRLEQAEEARKKSAFGCRRGGLRRRLALGYGDGGFRR